jgi:hypothetical protein
MVSVTPRPPALVTRANDGWGIAPKCDVGQAAASPDEDNSLLLEGAPKVVQCPGVYVKSPIDPLKTLDGIDGNP